MKSPPVESYTVRPGDSLFGIAESRETTVEALMSRNGLADRASIYAGQEILVPANPAARPSTGDRPLFGIVGQGLVSCRTVTAARAGFPDARLSPNLAPGSVPRPIPPCT